VSGQQTIDLESAAPTTETAPGAGQPAKSDSKADDGESAPKQAIERFQHGALSAELGEIQIQHKHSVTSEEQSE